MPKAPAPETVNVSFSINRPADHLVIGSRQVLRPLCQALKIDVFDLATAIGEQQNVGNIVCLAGVEDSSDDEDDDEESEKSGSEDEESETEAQRERAARKKAADDEQVIVGVFSILNLLQHGKLLKPLRDAIAKSKNKTLCALIASPEEMLHVGVLLAERMATSMPASICGDIFEECKRDVQWTLDLDPEELEPAERDELKYYHFKTLLVIATGYTTPLGGSPKKRKRSNTRSDDDPLVEQLLLPDADMQALFLKRTAAIALAADTSAKNADGEVMQKYLVIFAISYASL